MTYLHYYIFGGENKILKSILVNLKVIHTVQKCGDFFVKSINCTIYVCLHIGPMRIVGSFVATSYRPHPLVGSCHFAKMCGARPHGREKSRTTSLHHNEGERPKGRVGALVRWTSGATRIEGDQVGLLLGLLRF
jgi:hypothetical protein